MNRRSIRTRESNPVDNVSTSDRSVRNSMPIGVAAENLPSARNTLSNGTVMNTRPISAEALAQEQKSNIIVAVRCRGRTSREVQSNNQTVIQVQPEPINQVTVQTSPGVIAQTRSFTYDHVFGPASDQLSVFEKVAVPLLHEVIAGYNGTIFAYGQTGTGKTYTMSGESLDPLADEKDSCSELAGIIPRALRWLFKTLQSQKVDFSVRISFIELYNEELKDLLSADDTKKMKIFDDNARKGSVVINDMEEWNVTSAENAVKLLKRGNFKRHTAATQCNDRSSRSHTIFTIYLKITEHGFGEDMVRTGKLNLVDLAGSENIGRSGAENKRAREAGMINQSLLTLGRVINSLVENNNHIPYRESKLTRLLQDSLGGRTKTCIIATVSPTKGAFDETISTLNYAARAKSIKNQPICNKLMTKKDLICEYALEIERLRNDLYQTAYKNGVYLSSESYHALLEGKESFQSLNEEQGRKIEVLEESLKTSRDKEEQLSNSLLEARKNLDQQEDELARKALQLEQLNAEVKDKEQKLANEIKERKELEGCHQKLQIKHKEVTDKLHHSSKMNEKLCTKIEELKEHNNSLCESHTKFRAVLSDQYSKLITQISEQNGLFKDQSEEFRKSLQSISNSFDASWQTIIKENELIQSDIIHNFDQSVSEILTSKAAISIKNKALQDLRSHLEDFVHTREAANRQKLKDAQESLIENAMELADVNYTSIHKIALDLKSHFEDIAVHADKQFSNLEEISRNDRILFQEVTNSATAQEKIVESFRANFEVLLAQQTKIAEQKINEALNDSLKTYLDGLSRFSQEASAGSMQLYQVCTKFSNQQKKNLELTRQDKVEFSEKLDAFKSNMKSKVVNAAELSRDRVVELQTASSDQSNALATLMTDNFEKISTTLQELSKSLGKTNAEVEAETELHAERLKSLKSLVSEKQSLLGNELLNTKSKFSSSMQRIDMQNQSHSNLSRKFLDTQAKAITALDNQCSSYHEELLEETGLTPKREHIVHFSDNEVTPKKLKQNSNHSSISSRLSKPENWQELNKENVHFPND